MRQRSEEGEGERRRLEEARRKFGEEVEVVSRWKLGRTERCCEGKEMTARGRWKEEVDEEATKGEEEAQRRRLEFD